MQSSYLDPYYNPHLDYYTFPTRQYDISRNSINKHVTIPIAVPYRLDAMDYVFFNYPCNFPAEKYYVVVESLSTASPNPHDRFRLVGSLKQKVELPQVHFAKGFGSHAKIGVLPRDKTEGLPSFLGALMRGNTYTIDPKAEIVTPQGHRALHRTGVY
jgi:hypothetical protein